MRYLLIILSFLSLSAQAQIIPAIASGSGKSRPLDTLYIPEFLQYSEGYQALIDHYDQGQASLEEEEHSINDQLFRTIDTLTDFDFFYKFSSSEQAFAQTNWFNYESFASAADSGAPNFVPLQGFSPIGSGSYLRTGFNPSVNAIHYKQDTAFFGVVVMTENDQDFATGSRATLPDVGQFLRTTGLARINSTSNITFPAPALGVRTVFVVARYGTTQKVFINGVQVGSSTGASTGLPDIETFIMTYNNAGVNGGPYGSNFYAAFAGGYIPDDHQLHFANALHAAIDSTLNIEIDGSGPIVEEPPAPPIAEGQLRLTSEMVLSDAPVVKVQSRFLFDGVTNVGGEFKGPFISNNYELIDGTGLRGHVFIIDLHGKCYVEALKITDGTGAPSVNIWKGRENMFELDSVTSVVLNSYLGTKTVSIDDTIRYIILNKNSIITGINELKAFGVRIDTVPEINLSVPGQKVKHAWSVNTHDYDVVPSLDSAGYLNIFDINPFVGARTYVELPKTFTSTNKLIKTSVAPGGLAIDQIQQFQARGGKLMLSPVGTLNQFLSLYPPHVFPGGEPLMYWDSTKTYTANKEAQTDPATWDTLRAMYVRLAEYIVAQPGRLDTAVIFSPWNEWDKTWFTAYHKLTPHAMAALLSMLWDGHQGQFGPGIKDVAPDMILAGPAFAFNNPGFVKLMVEWFKKNRSDGRFCADMICVNSYCNSRSGFQHDPNAIAIPPEGTEWIEEMEKMAMLAQSLGLLFAMTEYGADATGADWNTNRVFIHDSVDAELHSIIDGKGDSVAYYYEEVFWPKYDSIILARQANYNLRYYLLAGQYAHYLYIYHIRDTEWGNENGSLWANVTTYSSTGIAYRMDAVHRASLLLKPSGELIKQFYNALKDYTYTSTVVDGEVYTQTYTNDLGDTKQVQWTTHPDSRPVILP